MSIATREVCICDQCGRERDKDSNHWWLLWIWWSSDGTGRSVSFRQWDDSVARVADTTHVCGLTCLYKAIDKLAQEILKREAVAK